MMDSLQIWTMWYWQSPAWWVALAATFIYTAVIRHRRVSVAQLVCWAVAIAAFVIALASPVAVLASRYLFSAHMAQHLLLLLIVPLFGLLAWPRSRMPARPGTPSSNVAASLGWAAGVGAMWFWHVPSLCTAAMRSPLVFDVQILSLVVSGVAFWRPVFGPNVHRRLPPQIAAGYLFAGCLGCSLLGIYITFSPVAVCPLYSVMPRDSAGILSVVREQWGFTHRIDQQVGGLLMWVPACMVYLGAIMTNLASWYRLNTESWSAGVSATTR
jgi:cytochrome c oxidase assembly factor CtaG